MSTPSFYPNCSVYAPVPFAGPGNSLALARFYHEVLKVWRKWLGRRRAWRASWGWFRQLLACFPLPHLRAIHSVCRGVANG